MNPPPPGGRAGASHETPHRGASVIADFRLALLRIAHPGFRFTTGLRQPGRHHWVAVRRNLAAGPHTVVTGDFDELLAVLGPRDLPGQPADRDLAGGSGLMRPPYGIFPYGHMTQAAHRPAPDTRLRVIWRRLHRKTIKDWNQVMGAPRRKRTY